MTSDAGWLVASKQIGVIAANGTDTFQVSFNLSGLKAGIYTGSLLVRSPGRPDRPLLVELSVLDAMLAPTSLTAFPPSLEFVTDGVSPAESQAVQFLSSDGAPVQVRIETEAGSPVSLPDRAELSAPGAVTVAVTEVSGRTATRLLVIPEDSSVEPIEIPVGIRQPEPALLSLPRIVDGGGFETLIVLTNLDNTPARVALSFFQAKEEGETASWPLVLDGAEDREAIEIPVGGSVTLKSRGLLGTAEAGWARVLSEQRIGGHAVLRRLAESGEGQDEAVVP